MTFKDLQKASESEDKLTVTGVGDGDQEIKTADGKKAVLLIADSKLVGINIKTPLPPQTTTTTTTPPTTTTTTTNKSDKDDDGFTAGQDKCPDVKGLYDGCPCKNPDRNLISMLNNGDFKIDVNADGEKISDLIKRIKNKKWCENPGTPEDIFLKNPNLDNDESKKILGGTKVIFKCLSCQ
jgi:hypothetical protein